MEQTADSVTLTVESCNCSAGHDGKAVQLNETCY